MRCPECGADGYSRKTKTPEWRCRKCGHEWYVVICDKDNSCELCGKPMTVKVGRVAGPFMTCTGFPDCRNVSPFWMAVDSLPVWSANDSSVWLISRATTQQEYETQNGEPWRPSNTIQQENETCNLEREKTAETTGSESSSSRATPVPIPRRCNECGHPRWTSTMHLSNCVECGTPFETPPPPPPIFSRLWLRSTRSPIATISGIIALALIFTAPVTYPVLPGVARYIAFTILGALIVFAVFACWVEDDP